MEHSQKEAPRAFREHRALFTEASGAVFLSTAVSCSTDMVHWTEEGLITLGQSDWSWARGRLTTGFVLDLRHEPGIGRYQLFFHGSGPEDEKTMFDSHTSIGIARSEDFPTWHWPPEKMAARPDDPQQAGT